jgi:hypothetical protein
MTFSKGAACFPPGKRGLPGCSGRACVLRVRGSQPQEGVGLLAAP